MNALPESHPLRGILAKVILQARRDVRIGMRRARTVLKRSATGKPLRQHHRITFPQVQAAHWVDTVSTEDTGFDAMCQAIGLDAGAARAEICAPLDRIALKNALLAQFGGSTHELNEWIAAGCASQQYRRKTGMTAFQEAA